MKKASIILVVLFFGIALNGFSQTAPNYFDGKWSVLIKATPNGDATVPMRFETKDGKTKGYFIPQDAKEETEMVSVNVKGEELTSAFNISGYDVTLVITKKDIDHANGKLMDMFDVEATKVK